MRVGGRCFEEEVLSNDASMSAVIGDTVPFTVLDLPLDVKMSLGHQLVETIPICTFEGVKCKEE